MIGSATTTTYSDITAQNGNTYYYVVSAVNSAGESDNSTEVSAMPQAPPSPPAAPSDLTATAESISQINLSWTDTDNESGFKIEISSNGTSFTQIGIVGANVTAYSSTGLSRNKTYYYRVRAFNDGGNGGYSNIASAKTLKNNN